MAMLNNQRVIIDIHIYIYSNTNYYYCYYYIYILILLDLLCIVPPSIKRHWDFSALKKRA